MAPLPEGTVTFLFSDVEGSTQLLEQHGAAAGEALARHHAIFEQLIDCHAGVIFETVGDAVYAAFASPAEAVAAALEVHRAFGAEDWGAVGRMAVRIAIHTGEVQRRGDHYFGSALFRAARLQAIGYGEQTLLSGITARLVADRLPEGASLHDLGRHRLKDLGEPEDVHQLVHGDLRREFPPLKSLEARPHNLPVQLSSFIGREREIAEIGDLLDANRLATLLGPGGIGKTRLALQVAAERLERHPDGVFVVDLSPVRDPEQVPGSIAMALGLSELPDRTLTNTIHDHLRGRAMLLVLDNLEQLLPAVARSVADLLQAAPALTVLATSRAPLRIRGEREYPVPALTARSTDGNASAAVALFLDRGRSIRADLPDDQESRARIAAICERLDGLPLAIELAAARLRVFSVPQLADRLSRRLPLLVGGSRDVSKRQQTMHAAIDWSVDLLDHAQQRLYARLGVFVASFDIEAAEAVAGDDLDTDVVDGITALVEQSLLRSVDAEGPRYLMLESIREHALDLLEAWDEVEATRRRNIDHWRLRAVQATTDPYEPEAVLRVVGPDRANFRTALTDAIDRRLQGPAVDLAATLAIVWQAEGPWHEGVQMVERVLAMGPLSESQVAGDLLHRAAALHGSMASLSAAHEYGLRALAIRRSIGDKERIANTLNNLALNAATATEALVHAEEAYTLRLEVAPNDVASWQWNVALARLGTDDVTGALAETHLTLAAVEREGNPVIAFLAHLNLGVLHQASGELDAARAEYGSALDEARKSEFATREGAEAICMAHIAQCKLRSGHRDEAGRLLEEASAVLPEAEDWFWRGFVMSSLFVVLAELSVSRGEFDVAAVALGAHATTTRGAVLSDPPCLRRDRMPLVAAAKAGLGSDRFAAAWRSGELLAPHEWLAGFRTALSAQR